MSEDLNQIRSLSSEFSSPASPGVRSPTQEFCIRDEASANWLVRRVKEARAYAEHITRWAAAEQLRAKREEAFLLGRYGQQLEQWLRGILSQEHRGRRSIQLPAGQVGLRINRAKPLVVHEGALAAWCRKHLPAAYHIELRASGDEAVQLVALLTKSFPSLKTIEGADKRQVSAHFTNTGDLPPGVEMRDVEERCFIR
jgi:hypothetical protein